MLNFSHIPAPLNKNLKKEQVFNLPPLGKNQSTAFTALIKAVTTPPFLALPKSGLPYSVDTYASDHQVGAALFQISPNRDRYPIGYCSRWLNPAEENYSTSERECLAVVSALTTLRPYLQGEYFFVHYEHASLRWLINIAEHSGRLIRWRLRLSEFKGYLNTQSDAYCDWEQTAKLP